MISMSFLFEVRINTPVPTSAGSWKKQESSRKASISAFLTMPKNAQTTAKVYSSHMLAK